MPYSARFDEALHYAHHLHRDQERKATGIPYIHHLLSVAALVGENGGTEDQVIAGLLHDAIEDQGGRETAEEIRRRFGETVVRIVEGCTDTDQTPKPPWRKRKEAYLAHLEHVGRDVLLVSIADKLHNARSIVMDLRSDHSVFDRFSGGREGTLWYYKTLGEIYMRRWPTPLVEEYLHTVRQMQVLAAR